MLDHVLRIFVKKMDSVDLRQKRDNIPGFQFGVCTRLDCMQLILHINVELNFVTQQFSYEDFGLDAVLRYEVYMLWARSEDNFLIKVGSDIVCIFNVDGETEDAKVIIVALEDKFPVLCAILVASISANYFLRETGCKCERKILFEST